MNRIASRRPHREEYSADYHHDLIAQVEGEGPFRGHSLVAARLVAVGVDLVARADDAGDVAALTVPCPGDRTQVAAGEHALWQRLAGHDPQVAGHLQLRRVIDHPQAHEVEEGRLPQLLGDAQTVAAVGGGSGVEVNERAGRSGSASVRA